jgi:peroxiredoxin (alkyl hydroperoxide reductase subunit C)
MTASSIDSPDWSKIPAPADDGAARHLAGMRLPAISLPATDGTMVDLSALGGTVVVYAYPRTGKPGIENPDGWDLIPGARGCTPQSCAFRDLFGELKTLGVDRLFGLSTQSTAYQAEAADRLHLPFPILSDESFRLTEALRLPTFETSGMKLLKRLTLVIADGVIEHVFYPVFPPDRNAGDVATWLSSRARSKAPPSR